MGKSALAITEEHIDLADSVFGQLNRVDSRAAARATLDGGPSHPAEIWSAAADLGWTGLAISEDHGGSGFGLAELAVVLEAQGHELTPGPFLPTVSAAVVIDRCGSDSLRAALLPGLADGSTVAALAASGTVSVGADLVVTGESPAVLGAPDAALLVAIAGDDVVVVDAGADGVTVTPLESIDTTRSLGAVAFDGVTVTEDRVMRGAARKARTVFRILTSAEAVGVSWAAMEMAVDYAKVREQFGRTIGTFQAVKHHAANMLVNAEATTAAAWDAARGDDLDGVWFAAAVAASNAIRTQILNAQTNIQLHGGIGFTWEHDAHLYLRRARTLAALMAEAGDPLVDVVEGQRSGQAHGATFTLPPEAEEFRAQARDAVAKLKSLPADQQRDFLVDSGYLVPHWPKPWGRAAGVLEQLVIEEEFAGIERPDMGITGWVTLTIAQAGTDEQRERWVEPVLRGEVMWCQLFSEPNAGSDAAAVRTSAKKVDGGWRVTGQKVWTSLAHMCQWGLATVRTDPDAPKHAGVTMMAIDMNAPGVTVNPLRGLTGHAHFNEVFFDDVFVPDSDVVGDVNKGWLVARATLGNERISIGGGSGGATGFTADDLIKLLDGAPTDVRAQYVRRAGEVLAETHTLRLLNLRRISRAIAGSEPGPEGNVTKLLLAEAGQRMTELAMELAGSAAVSGQTPTLTQSYLGNRAMTIAGGTSEITRNTIAERILGLPRDPLLK
ncbi:acyl-CoA dehydrogenase [Mycolicibacterium phlei]|uniref:Acyl-CoA dehydrogenase n=1 Tax=Mycolicibacterium phlei DSM 43239 = CCUG 21000 TaxID=1226750 RepID=A0A5N5VCI0_MYCPH|nr:acyl-CoA dehydrogenase [Mycolicibacterium phlei]VEG11765.1 acyl-CoA dehydrogenase [Mycobacteroides chelonae]AMO63672.1 Acyl-CoA dehydrogenase fadE12 [Mycolicibacterium phlei]KAB7759498.1 acyl-CoA dehydrogenase [Mycolicibacterium phlei DSM 43239 = CCUG 21000]KXW60111.1 acyl-CoA dehydrogenase [Mycolicibacterium phlei DSM 43072]KXW68540.1 acyl-CoA dehydrogenase [Mycolicibacterium phlei DSM 43239 = CCUG 21000]